MRATSHMRDRLTFLVKTPGETDGEPTYTYPAGDSVFGAVESLPGAGLLAALARLEPDIRFGVTIDPHPSAVNGNRVTMRGRDYLIRDVDDALPGQVTLVLKEVVRG